MKKYIIIILIVISYISISGVIGCAAYHMYYHHDKQAAIGMVIAFIDLCLCDFISYLYHYKKDKGRITTTNTPT